MEEGTKGTKKEKNVETKQKKKQPELGTILLIIIVALLAVNIYLQRPVKNEGCTAAKDFAADVLKNSDLNYTLLDDYNSAVYDHASNINQQIFYANDYQFRILTKMNMQQLAILNLLKNCP